MIHFLARFLTAALLRSGWLDDWPACLPPLFFLAVLALALATLPTSERSPIDG